MALNTHRDSVRSGQRFEFGKNWTGFLATLNEAKIVAAENDLRRMLDLESLNGLTFLDIGSGSGLSSLAARRLGATVQSFDYDPQSVTCTKSLRERFFPGDKHWTIEEASVLDADYLRSLGRFDIVYSWGVLHHTGAMWQGLENSLIPVTKGGRLFLAIYNRQLTWTKLYKVIKRSYNSAPRLGKWAIILLYFAVEAAINLAKDFATLRNPLRRYLTTYCDRGMGRWHDLIDWVGGYPFETARPDEIFHFYYHRGLSLERLVTGGGHACNQFVFRRGAKQPSDVVLVQGADRGRFSPSTPYSNSTLVTAALS